MMEPWLAQIAAYQPESEQEASDQRLISGYAARFPDTVLTRENELAHITSSGFIVNRALTRTLMVFHSIRNTWSWTGGHADGEPDLLSVALREAAEETGAQRITPLTREIASLDILVNFGHVRRGQYVSAHLHLNVSYLLIAEEGDALLIKPDENSDVRWLDSEALVGPLFRAEDQTLYGKLMQKARRIAACK